MTTFRVTARRSAAVVLASTTVLALGLAPAAASQRDARAAHHTSFGALLSTHSQPSNAFDGQPCEPHSVTCSRVMTAAYRRSDPQTDVYAPKNGTIGKIRIVAGVPGKFRLQIVKAEPEARKAKLVRNGPVITYHGQGTGEQDNGPPYTIESFPVNVKIDKGEYLAVKATQISFEYCSGGGLNQITYEPPLVKSKTLRHTRHTDGCLMLLEAVYK